MGRWTVVTFAATLVVAGMSDSVRAETSLTQLHVRIYDNTRLPRGHLAESLIVTSSLLASVGLDVWWLDCSAAGPVVPGLAAETAASCREPLAAGELALRIVHAPTPPGYRGQLPLGDSLIDHDRGLGVLATIYYERVEWFAGAAKVALPPVLAHAIAHEIAHLIIGSSEHAESGLMRPVWRGEDLLRNRSRDWQFSPGDVKAIQARRNE
jgi:hypothetical protein